MLYELSHFLKKHCSFIWNLIEWCNACIFNIQHKKGLTQIPAILANNSNKFSVEEIKLEDVDRLAVFFSEQPAESFTFFKPHEFDSKSFAKLVKRKSFLMFKVIDKEEIIGYFFLRCFANGNAFKGRIVDYRKRNQGIAKQMGNVINDVVLALKLKLFTTISPKNYSSLASTKAVNEIKIVRTLENG